MTFPTIPMDVWVNDFVDWLIVTFTTFFDGISLAIGTMLAGPIFVDEAVLDKASILFDKETGKPILPESGKGKKLSEDELRRMSAFTDFINTLDLDDFDKR